jgi:four helix bundle protein
MDSGNIIADKTFDFAGKIIKTYRTLSKENREFVLSKQLLRSGTSIGANVEEAIGGSSKRDFKYKLQIAYREARETKYWLRVLHHSDYLQENQFKDLIQDNEEILKILYSIIQSTK